MKIGHYAIIALLILLLGGVIGFFIGRNQCEQCIEKKEVKTSVKVDTKQKESKMTWKPKKANPKYQFVKSLPPKNIIAVSDTNIIIDSIANVDGVGLQFRHVVSNNEIQLSEYKINYPERTITIEKETVQTIKPKVNAFDFGVGVLLSDQIDIIPNLGYRYDKLRISAGYMVRSKGVFIGMNRTF